MSEPGDGAPAAEQPRENAAASEPSDDPPAEQSRIVIRPDGQVVIENLSALLAEVATALDPEAELACRLELDDSSTGDDEPPNR